MGLRGDGWSAKDSARAGTTAQLGRSVTAYFTMQSAPGFVDWPSSIRTDTSRSAVDGTPSSSSSSRIFFIAQIVLVRICRHRYTYTA